MLFYSNCTFAPTTQYVIQIDFVLFVSQHFF